MTDNNLRRVRPAVENLWTRKGKFYTTSAMYPYVEGILDGAGDEIRKAIALRKGNAHLVPQRFEDWVQERFYIPQTGKPAVLFPHQIALSRLMLTRNEKGKFPYSTLIYSTIKKSGKSTWAGMVMRWYAETGQRHSELFCLGNDRDQAKLRSFREIRRSLELAPTFDHGRDRLPGEWNLQKETFRCLRTGTEIRALPIDPKGEAGGAPAMQCWTELWGVDQEAGQKFWDELTPVPTIPDSIRIVETYAGFLQDSLLLYELYETGLHGHQLTAGELAERTDTAIGTFHEAPNAGDLVPIWINEAAGLCMYWDDGVKARRMPWQLGEEGDQYYREQEQALRTPAFRRLHYNEWVSDTENFIQPELWDACKIPSDEAHLLRIPEPGDKTPLVLGVDAATTGDCFAIVLVSRHPTRPNEVLVRAVKVYDPKQMGGVVDYSIPDYFIRFLCEGGHIEGGQPHPKSRMAQDAYHAETKPDGCRQCEARVADVPPLNIMQIAYDPYQLEKLMQDMRRDLNVWCEPFNQSGMRLVADRGLYDGVIRKQLWHAGGQPGERDERLRHHVLGAGAKMAKDEDTKLRLVKTAPHRKIDAAVALSMAADRCLYLNM